MARKDHGRQVPDLIKGDEDAQAVFGIVEPVLNMVVNAGASDDDAADVALKIISIIKQHHIVDVWSNDVAQNNMRNAIDDYFFDVVRDKKGIDIPVERLDQLELQIMDLARARFPG
jgi:type I restriction enzyme R subunit